ncbi:MAG: ABC transporter permease [Chloroflexota bacterium]
MNLRIVGALISKDFRLFFRNRFFALMTALGIIVYLVIYFVLPSSVNETLEIGLYAPVMPPVLEQIGEEGLQIKAVESEEALRETVAEGQYLAGVALPADIGEKLMLGQKPRINVYFAPDTPVEMKDAVQALIRELAYTQTGQPLPIEVSEEILGPDMAGMQIPPRDRLRPLFAVLLIMTETFFLATLVSEEVERRTIQALLVTPMTVRELFAAKGITGIGLAFGEAALFMAVVGGLSGQPVIILAALLLGAVLVTGIGFLMATMAKDMISVMAWGFPALIILIIPSVTVLFPGATTVWVKAIPSYYLVDTVNRVVNFGAGWGDVLPNLLVLLGFGLVVFWAGISALRRRFQ